MKKESVIFNNPIIREIIENKWATIRPRVWKLLLIPYCIFVTIVMIYVLLSYFEPGNEHECSNIGYGFRIAISIFAFIFLLIEILQMFKYKKMKDHFNDFWNYLDIFISLSIFIAEGTRSVICSQIFSSLN